MFSSTRFPRFLSLAGLLALLMMPGLVGCNTLGNMMGRQNQQQVRASIDEIARDYIVADRTRYEITRNTSFGRYSSLSDLSIGDEVLIEYETDRNRRARRAVRIERSNDDRDNGY